MTHPIATETLGLVLVDGEHRIRISAREYRITDSVCLSVYLPGAGSHLVQWSSSLTMTRRAEKPIQSLHAQRSYQASTQPNLNQRTSQATVRGEGQQIPPDTARTTSKTEMCLLRRQAG